MPRRFCLLLALLSAWLYVGCGDNESKEGLSDAETVAATATKSRFHDFESVELSNGLVHVMVVPQLGGRVLGYEFADRSLLYANPKLFGRLPGEQPVMRHPWVPGTSAGEGAAPEPTASERPVDTGQPAGERPPALATPPAERDVPGGGVEEVPTGGGESNATGASDSPSAESDTAVSERTMPEAELTEPRTPPEASVVEYVPSPQSDEAYPNYGGQVTLPAPQSHWVRAWPPPLALDLGRYADDIPKSDGDTVELKLQSPPDEELGVTIVKVLSLPRASSVLRIDNVVKNIGERTKVWSVADISQHPGALAPGETFTRDARVLVPLNPESRHHLGFASLLGSPVSEQYFPENGILRVEYLGKETLAGVDSYAGWAAYSDRRNDVVLVKLALLNSARSYPGANLTTTVYTAPSAVESYLQLAFRSPLAELKPKEEVTFTVWYAAARCPQPIVHATAAGVVNTPLKAEKLGDSVHLTGTFGVFYTGFATVEFYDLDGKPLARTQPVPVTPLQPYLMDTMAPLPDGAVRAALLIQTSRRVDVAELSDCGITEVRATPAGELAAKPEEAKPTEQPTAPTVTVTTETPREPAAEAPMPAAGEGPTLANPTDKQPSSPEPEPAAGAAPRPDSS